MAKANEKIDVEILDVRDVTTYPTPGKPAVTRVITYRSGDLPPRAVFIPAAEDTPENRARIIRADVEAARAFKPTRMTV